MFGKLVKRGLPLMAGLCVLMGSGVLGVSEADAKELRVLAWQGYADDDWVKEATAKGADGKKLLEAARALLNQYDK